MFEGLLFLLPPFTVWSCNEVKNQKLRPTYDIFEVFFVTAARTPPSPLSLAVPFFLPDFVGI